MSDQNINTKNIRQLLTEQSFPPSPNGWDSIVADDLIPLELAKEKATFSFVVKEKYCNYIKRAISTIIDIVSTYIILTSGIKGVTTDSNITFCLSAPMGSRLHITAEIIKEGKALAFLTSKITSEAGNIIAAGRQTRFKFSM